MIDWLFVKLYRLQTWRVGRHYKRFCPCCGAFFNDRKCPICGSGETLENTMENYLRW